MQPARADPDELAARLQGQDAATRAAAADALAALSRRAAVAVPALGNVLSDVEPQVRWRAAWALARIGEPAAPAAPALVERLGDDERAVRFAAAVALSRLGAVVVPRLAQVLQDPTSNANAREAAALALERLGPPAAPALPALRDAVRRGNTKLRGQKIRTLAALGPAAEPALPELVKSLGATALHDDLADAFAAVGSASAAPLGETLRAKGDRSRRIGAARGLGRLGPGAAPATPALRAALKERDEKLRLAVVGAVRAIGPGAAAAEPELWWVVRSDFGDLGRAAFRAIYALGGPEVRRRRDDVRAQLEDIAKRRQAGLMLRTGGLVEVLRVVAHVESQAVDAVPVVTEAVALRDDLSRGWAALALGRAGLAARAALPQLLVNCVPPPSRAWYEAALENARSLRKRTLQRQKAGLFTEGPTVAALDKSIQHWEEMLAEIGEEDPLFATLASLWALGMVGDKDPHVVKVLTRVLEERQRIWGFDKRLEFSYEELQKLPQMARLSLWMLDGIPTRNRHEALAALLPDYDWGPFAQQCVVKLGPKAAGAVDALLKYAPGSDAVVAVGEAAVPGLVRRFGQTDDKRRTALDVLRRMGPRGAKAGAAVVKECRRSDSAAAEEALVAMGAAALPALAAGLADRNRRVRESCARVLRRLGVDDSQTRAALEKGLGDESVWVRYEAAVALAWP
ncbi:MAG: HEAT repeat domain-containing protein [Planctomycetota bacterium]